jgi:uncharacterized coiled-coil DUF342 family protein
MIEGLSKVLTMKGEANKSDSDDSVERVAIAGANAIQRLIADRDDFRNRANVQHQDLLCLSAINKELRDRIVLIRHHYVELATRIIAQLEQFDRATRDALQDKDPAPTPQSDDADLLALANRLKPDT